MNLAVSRNLDNITPENVPPLQRRGRLRLLCIGLPIMGLNSFNKELERACAVRDDVEAVHIYLRNSLWVKIGNRISPLPLSLDLQCFRVAQQWRSIMRRWFRPGGPLDLARFDAAVVCPQAYALALAEAKAAGRKLTLCVHIDATTQNTVRDFGDSWLTTRPLDWVDRRVFARADVVSCMGMWAGNSARDDYGVPAERVLWIPPVSPSPPPPPARGLNGSASDDGGLPRIVFVGNGWVRKGGPELLKWHQQRWADRAELHFIGHDAAPDPSRPKPRNVVFHGRVDRDRIMNELLPSMDLFVMPTKREMSSWAGMEAMAAGLPVVLSRIGGIPDLVIDGETGFLAKPNDETEFVRAVETLLNDPERRRRMGRAARERALTEFSRDTVYSRLLDRLRKEAERDRPAEATAEAAAETGAGMQAGSGALQR